MKKIYHSPLVKAIVLASEPLLASSSVSVYDANAAKDKEVLSNHRTIWDNDWLDDDAY